MATGEGFSSALAKMCTASRAYNNSSTIMVRLNSSCNQSSASRPTRLHTDHGYRQNSSINTRGKWQRSGVVNSQTPVLTRFPFKSSLELQEEHHCDTCKPSAQDVPYAIVKKMPADTVVNCVHLCYEMKTPLNVIQYIQTQIISCKKHAERRMCANYGMECLVSR